MKLTRNQGRQIEKLSPHVDRVTQGDMVWFENNPDRYHRIRFASECEVAAIEIMEDRLMQPPPPFRWFTIVRNVYPGARIRVFAVAPGGASTGLDVPEECAREAFDEYATPWTVSMELALRDVRDVLSTEVKTGGRTPA
jgi:hypothetical protein